MRPIRLLNNAVFEVTGDGVHLALRIHRPGYRSLGHIETELQVLDVLADELHGSAIAVPRPLAARDGAPLVSVNDETTHYCDLLTWIDGRVLRGGGRGLGERSTFLLGTGLGRLHNVTAQLGELELPRWDGDTLFSEASPFDPGPMDEFLAPEAWEVFQDVAARSRAIFAELAADQRGVIHNDYILGNCHFTRARSGWKLGVLDFDDLGFGFFLYDLAPLLGNLFDWPESYARLRRALLEGYRSVRALPDELERHLPVLMAARHASTLTWLAAKHRRGETDVPIERHVEIRVAEMQRCLALCD